MNYKVCRRCNRELPEIKFHKKHSRRAGSCRECQKLKPEPASIPLYLVSGPIHPKKAPWLLPKPDPISFFEHPYKIVTQRCYSCKTIKPVSDFHRKKSMPSGFTDQCKICKNLQNLGRPRKGKSVSPLFRRQKHASKRVARALKHGRLNKKPCQICGDPLSQAHHQDYSRPLSVVWLCKSHHAQVHSGAIVLNQQLTGANS